MIFLLGKNLTKKKLDKKNLEQKKDTLKKESVFLPALRLELRRPRRQQILSL